MLWNRNEEGRRTENFKGLTVIECGHCYNRWRVDTRVSPSKVISSIKPFKGPRDVEYYRKRGLYEEMGLPVEIREADFEKYKQYEPYIGIMKNFSDEVCRGLKKGNAVLIPTGYCAYAPAIAGGIQRALGTDKKIGVVWIDAHADNRVVETSELEEVRLVGIPVSAMAGQTMEKWRKEACGLEIPCEGKNILASDLRMTDEEFERNKKAAGLIHLTAAEFEDEERWKTAVSELAGRVDVIYLSVDADILRAEDIPAYEKYVPEGHTIACVSRNIQIVMETGKVVAYSLFCIDFDHYEKGGERMYESGRCLLSAGIGKWKRIST